MDSDFGFFRFFKEVEFINILAGCAHPDECGVLLWENLNQLKKQDHKLFIALTTNSLGTVDTHLNSPLYAQITSPFHSHDCTSKCNG